MPGLVRVKTNSDDSDFCANATSFTWGQAFVEAGNVKVNRMVMMLGPTVLTIRKRTTV
jgi:hypothetical protein